MANRQHLAQLKKGTTAWNRWRAENFKIVPDLKGSSLKGALLAGTNLSFAALSEADLEGADLREADLTGAVLQKANLKGAVLNGARLKNAHLGMADLTNASLVNSELDGADLKHADITAALLGTASLRNAELSNARLDGASLGWADLSLAKLSFASLRGASCQKTQFSHAILESTDLRGADLRSAKFADAYLPGVKFSRQGRFLGVQLAGAHGSRRFLRFAAHQDVIEELRSAGPRGMVCYGLWLLAVDCGRTLWPWLGWCLTLVAFFAAVFYLAIGPRGFETGAVPWDVSSILAFSLANFAALDTGWLQPVNTAARAWVAAEAFSGYVMLALLIASLTGRWSRR